MFWILFYKYIVYDWEHLYLYTEKMVWNILLVNITNNY